MNNIKIGVKLIGGFIIVALIAGVIGVFGISSMKTIDNADTVLFEKMTVPLGILVDYSTAYQRIRINLRDMIRANDPAQIEKFKAAIDGLDNELTKGEEEYRKTFIDKNDEDIFNDFIQKKNAYDVFATEIQDLAKQNKDAEAYALLDGAALSAGKVANEAIDKITSMNVAAAKEQSNKNTKTASSATFIMIIVMIIGVVLAVIIGIFLTISITTPLVKGVNMMLEMAKGHLGTRLKMNRKDEIGQLADAMDTFSEDLQKNIVATVIKIGEGDLSVDLKPKDAQDEIIPAIMNTTTALRGLIAEAGMLRKAAIDGKLATRGKAENFKGGYKDIVQGVNDCLDAVIGPLNVAAEYVDRISKGDIPAKITDNYNGDFNEIKNNLNKCIEAVNALVTDAAMLSKAAVEGKLATRADASKHQGDYRKIVQGVDDCLDAVIGPLNVTAKYVDDISKGVIPPIITDNYNGDFNIIKTNLNAVVKMMSELLKETDIIIKGAADGELDKRADASKFVGGWNQLVSGVNESITNIVNPMMVTADYVDKVAKGVIPPEITTVYKGQYNLIKINLNAMVKMMSELLSETDIIIKGAADGELDKRADASKFVGGWNKLVAGVNESITNIVNPMMVTADYVDKVAKGVIPPEITTIYKGQYNLIKTNLNGVVKMMSDLLKETNGLVQAALNGSLSTRANAALFIGGWNELVVGINKTLDSVLEPINEAAAILEKVAARDMSARVKGDYKGDHAKIKISLNSAVENLDTALQQVAEGVEQVSSAGQQISAGSQSLAQGANEQASSLEEVSSSLEEMSSMTKQNAENANQAKTLAGEANTNAAQGKQAMARMSDAINKIKESSDQTAKIVKTIDEIAMQTNLLALNAAVEAARAGEAGRGFAVVAEEVRNLAQRSAQAAKNTADMIAESVKNSEDGVKIAVDVSKSFEAIATGNAKVNDLIGEIAAASKEQSQGIDQVNGAVAEMDKVTQQNAASSEESASSAEELSGQAEELQSMVAQFILSQSTQKKPAAAVRQIAHAPARTEHKQPRIEMKKAPAHKKVEKFSAEDVIPMESDVLKEF